MNSKKSRKAFSGSQFNSAQSEYLLPLLDGAPENLIQDFQQKIWKEGLNSVTLRQLDNIVKDIQNGRIETDTARRLRRIAEQSQSLCVKLPRIDNGRMVRDSYRPRGESIPLIAAQICGGSCSRINQKTSGYYVEQLIEKWARHAACWIDDITQHAAINSWKRAEELDGTESKIFIKPNNTIVKVWSMKSYFNNPRLAVEKITLHNFLFGSDTPLSVIGFTKINHFFHFILEQPLINYTEESFNSVAIRNYLQRKFPNYHIDKVEGQFVVHHPDFYIWDLHAGNVVRMSKSDNKFYVIDCNIMFKNNAGIRLDGLQVINLKNLIVSILSSHGYAKGKHYSIKYYKSSPYWANRGFENVQECWIRTKYGNAKIDQNDYDDLQALTNYVCGLVDPYRSKQTTLLEKELELLKLCYHDKF